MEDASKFLPPATLNYTIGQIRGLRPAVTVLYKLADGETGTVGCRCEGRKSGWRCVFVPQVSPDHVVFSPTDAEVLAAVNGRKPLVYSEVNDAE